MPLDPAALDALARWQGVPVEPERLPTLAEEVDALHERGERCRALLTLDDHPALPADLWQRPTPATSPT